VKVPPTTPPSEKAPTYDKDRTLTRRSVAGAAGGMKGVDYEDDRRPEPGKEGAARTGPGAGELRAGERSAPLGGAIGDERQGPAQPDASKILLDNEGAAPLHTRRRRRFVARDRLTIDKDAPELKRNRKHNDDEDESSDERSAEQTLEFFPDAVGAAGLAPSVSRAQLFSPESRPEPGDLSLTDPDTIQRALETPLAYAKHAMILAEALRRSTGATRHEAIDYLARMFVAPRDRTFGRSALKEFGPSSGILDVYPLEVVTHVLDHYPHFLPKVSRGRFFHQSGERAQVWHTDTQTPVILEYPEDLKVRGFALMGGGTPGYVFEPADAPGRYRLQVRSPGRWTCSVSGVSRTGHTTVDTLVLQVSLAPGDTVLPPLGEPYPARDAARVAAWPMPSVPVVHEAEAVESRPTEDTRLSTGELLHQRARDDERRLRDLDLEVSEADAPIAERAPPAIPEAETVRERPPRSSVAAATRPATPAPRGLPPRAATDPSVRATRTPVAPRVAEASTEPGAPRPAHRATPRSEEPVSGILRAPQAPPAQDTTADLPGPETAAERAHDAPPRGVDQGHGGAPTEPARAAALGTNADPARARPHPARADGPQQHGDTNAARPRTPLPNSGAGGSPHRAAPPARSPIPAAATSPGSPRSPETQRTQPRPPAVPTEPRAVARPMPRPRPTAVPERSDEARVDRAELSGAIADAFARLAATPLSAPPPSARTDPGATKTPVLAPVVPPPPPRTEAGPTGAAPPGAPGRARMTPQAPAVTGVRPTAPLFDDTDTPTDLEDVDGGPEELDPAWVQDVSAPAPLTSASALEPPTARIQLHPELAADLMLDAEVPRTAGATAQPLPRTLRRSSSLVDPSAREPDE
jgi:hypothetical protein